MSIKKLLSAAVSAFWIGLVVWQVGAGLAKRDAADGDEPSGRPVAVGEVDGGELTTLMQGLHDALIARDPVQFEGFFSDASTAKLVWRRVERYRRRHGDYLTDIATTPPCIERAATDVHVRALVVHAWYDLSRDHTVSATPLHHATWEFERVDSRWRVKKMRLQVSTFAYEGMVRRLLHTSYLDLASLHMEWVESVDPSPVIAHALRAASRKNLAELQRCALHGVVLQAQSRDVRLPDVRTPSGFVGQMSAVYAESALRRQIGDLRRRSRRLGTSPTGLIPFFTAYRISCMPAECTQLAMWIDFDGGGHAAPVGGFAVEWCAGFVAHKWLAISLAVDHSGGSSRFSRR